MAEDEQCNTPQEEEEDLDALWGAGPRRIVHQAQEGSSEEDSYFEGSEEKSEDSAAQRAREAEERLRAHEASSNPAAAAVAPVAATALPSAGAVFDEVDGPPAFLDPEATRPLATTVHQAGVGGGGGKPRATSQAVNKRGQPAGEWDISKMAPQLKEEGQSEPGVIKGAAVRYSTADERVQFASAAAIAMLGGIGREDDAGTAAGGGSSVQGAVPPQHRVKAKTTPAMPVDKFMEKGVGGAQLPRKRQDRKDKEKDKRMRGQSTHAQWKSEAEMVLRQQFD